MPARDHRLDDTVVGEALRDLHGLAGRDHHLLEHPVEGVAGWDADPGLTDDVARRQVRLASEGVVLRQGDVERLAHQRDDLQSAVVPGGRRRGRVRQHHVVVGGQVADGVGVLGVGAQQLDVGPLGHPGQQPGQQHLPSRREGHQRDAAGRLLHEGAPLALGPLDRDRDVGGRAGQRSTRLGQRHAPPGRLDEGVARLLLQRLELLRHRRRCDPHRIGDGTHRAPLRQFPQNHETTDIHVVMLHVT